MGWAARAKGDSGETLGIAASMTAAPAQPYIWWQARKAGLAIDDVFLAPFNQIHQALLSVRKSRYADLWGQSVF